MQQWTTLLGFCLTCFSNGIGFGLYTCNLSIYAKAFQTTASALQNTFYIGLVVQVLFCLPAIRLIQWRLDFALISGAYLTASNFWIQYFSQGNIVIVSAALVVNSVAQLYILPVPAYFAQQWFPLQKRSLVIGLGVAFGAILSASLSVPGSFLTVNIILNFLAVLSTCIFIASIFLIKNQPKVRIQKKKKVQWRHAKDLWRQKFTSYNILMASVFLGISWTFISQFQALQKTFPYAAAALTLTWIVSGVTFGIFMSYMVQRWLTKTGDYKFYDKTCKIILFIGILGNTSLGVIDFFNIKSFAAHILFVILIGIGTIGFFGLAFLSLIQSMYPVPVLLIGTLISLFASIYSIISLAVSQIFPKINPYLSLSMFMILPWVYYLVTFQTNFKRYKYYLNEKQSKFQLLKIQEMSQKMSQKNQD